jgi:hypothetical protein
MEIISLGLLSSVLLAYRDSKVLWSCLMLLRMSSVNMATAPSSTAFTSGLGFARHSRSERCSGPLET